MYIKVRSDTHTVAGEQVFRIKSVWRMIAQSERCIDQKLCFKINYNGSSSLRSLCGLVCLFSDVGDRSF